MRLVTRSALASALIVGLLATGLPASASTTTTTLPLARDVVGAVLPQAEDSQGEAEAADAVPTEEYTVSIGDAVYDDRDTGMMLSAPGCNAGDPESKRVTNWQRRNPNGVAKLVCGNSQFGWRHIAGRHGQDYQNIVTKYRLGRSWDDFAKWAMSTTVGAPQAAPVRNNNTWGYTAPIQIKNKQGQVVRTYSMLVSVSRSDEKIITAFPR
ncbi:hypothetical protein QE412_002028 [Microbacterium trichothecenolyticum]|uniref:Uncharacterized protein n=1 Tax=Microbacterium trichothecenolyticum TaxID=69370 RepID=A0ABU0TUW8_MICTR|nr:hypothetical protein [Microbacterium trichothecenolyticum]